MVDSRFQWRPFLNPRWPLLGDYEKLPTLVFIFPDSLKMIPESFKEYTKNYIWDTFLLHKHGDYDGVSIVFVFAAR